jgi:hypothetical protein
MPRNLTKYQITILRAVEAGDVSRSNRGFGPWWIVDPARDSGYRAIYNVIGILENEGLVESGEPGPKFTPAVLTAKGKAFLEDPDARAMSLNAFARLWAGKRGHDIERDPTAYGLRWTCKNCGRTVIANKPVIYGTAITEDCTSKLAPGGDDGRA